MRREKVLPLAQIAPALSFPEALEKVQALRANAMQRAKDFAAAGSPFSPHQAIADAAFFDALSFWLQQVPEVRRG